MSRAVQPTREDFLDEDPEIASQKYVLLSFISPEKVLQTKDKFFFENFIKDYEIQYKLKSLEQFLGNTVLQFNRKLDAAADNLLKSGADTELIDSIRAERIQVDGVMEQFQEFVRKNKKDIGRVSIDEDYKDFLFRHETKLEEEFFEKNGSQTSMRGLKVRGVYATTKEAEVRAKKLVRSDPIHNILVGEVGKWLPWDPSPNSIQEQEYAEEQLNQLMKSYKQNEENVDNFYKEKGVKRNKQQIQGAGIGAAPVTDAGANTGGEHDGLFGATDLALQRKVEAQLAEAVGKTAVDAVAPPSPPTNSIEAATETPATAAPETPATETPATETPATGGLTDTIKSVFGMFSK
jgi:hypothetical protein